MLQKVEKSSQTLLDRWSISITEIEESASNSSQDHLDRRCVSEKIPFNIINNYFSIGVVSWPGYMGKVCILWSNCAFSGRRHLLKVSPRAREEPSKVQQPYEEQTVVL